MYKNAISLNFSGHREGSSGIIVCVCVCVCVYL